MLREPALVSPGPGWPRSAVQRWLSAYGRRSLFPRPQCRAQGYQGHRELVRQRRVWPTVGMGQGNELSHGPLQGGSLRSDLPLGLRLRLGHPPLRLGLHLDQLRGQGVDSLDHTRAQGLDARVVRFGKGTGRIGATARKQLARVAVLAQDERRATARAVGGQAIGGRSLGGLGQVHGQRGHWRGLLLFLRDALATARGRTVPRAASLRPGVLCRTIPHYTTWRAPRAEAGHRPARGERDLRGAWRLAPAHAITRTMRSTEARWPCQSVPRVSSTERRRTAVATRNPQGMAVGAAMAQPHPASRRTGRVRADVHRGVDLAAAPRGHAAWWRRCGGGQAGSGGGLTGIAGRLGGEGRKGFGLT